MYGIIIKENATIRKGINMWNSMKSVRLSLICTKIVMLLIVVCGVSLPFVLERYMNYAMIPMELSNMHPFMAILYMCSVPAMTALLCLHKLLGNIKRAVVFEMGNVKLLRIISWCCFATALLLVFAVRYYLLLGLVGITFGFIGLILRVVKNVIEEAVHIKAENELTI